MRIVSLLPGATELVFALGAGDQLVGRSHECDFPIETRSLPECTRPAFDVNGTSAQIDQRVRQFLRQGKPLYKVDGNLLELLAPDVVIAQAHCEVCAVGPEDFRRNTNGSTILTSARVVELTAATLDEMFQAFTLTAEAIDCADEGHRLIGRWRERIDSVRQTVRNLPRPTIECLEWIDPVFPMGNWGPELVEIAGGLSRLGHCGSHSAATEWDRVREADPEILLIAPCGFGLARTRAEMRTMVERPGWADLSAVQNRRVFIADGNRYFNRSGPSVVESVEILAELLHPTEFPAHRLNDRWEPYPAQATATAVELSKAS